MPTNYFSKLPFRYKHLNEIRMHKCTQRLNKGNKTGRLIVESQNASAF